jgi:alkylhydroperoxidase family enzyme
VADASDGRQRPKPGRLKPLEPGEWDDRTRALLRGTVAPVAGLEEREQAPASQGPLNILRTIAHHPRLLEPFLAFAATLAVGGVLPRRDSELLALRAAWNCRSPFEWGHHVIYARAAGLEEGEIRALSKSADTHPWAARDRALLDAADELHERQDVSDDTWDRLAEHLNEAQLLEVPFVVGNYTMLSMVANATAVPLELELPKLP